MTLVLDQDSLICFNIDRKEKEHLQE